MEFTEKLNSYQLVEWKPDYPEKNHCRQRSLTTADFERTREESVRVRQRNRDKLCCKYSKTSCVHHYFNACANICAQHFIFFVTNVWAK